MHFTSLPGADVLVAVGPLLRAMAVSLAEFECALIIGTIRIGLATIAVHRVISPLAVVERAIRPALLAVTSLESIDELTLE